MKKLLFLLLLVMTMPMTMMAQVEIDGIYYHFNGGNAEVINHYNQYTGDIVIPSTVTYNNVVYNVIIDNDAFNSCPGLTSVSIGKGVKRIGENAFLCCPGLTSITVDSENPIYDSRNNCNAIIEKSTNTLIVGCKNTIIPDDVTSIRYDAFYGCTGLTSITIPNSVTSIGEGAFENCTGLVSITVDSENPNYDSRNNCNAIIEKSTNRLMFGCNNTIIPDDVTSIRSYAFFGCTGLTSIDIPDGVTSIGTAAFVGCTGLTSITVDSENPNYDSRNNCNAIIEKSTNTLMFGCKNTIIPDDVTSIGDRAFYGCTGLTSIDIPDGVTSIGIEAFSGCSGLTSIDIPDGVTSIGDGAFSGCTGLTSVSIGNGVTSIGYGAFSGCTGLTSITVDSENPNYDSRNNCNAIIEKSNNTLMLGCNNTIIPDDVTSIGDYAFVGCSGLTSIDIPDGVTSIGIEAFSGCTGLTSIDIPNSVTSITTWAFANCEALEVVTCRATSVPDTEADAFDGSNVENATLIVPDEAYTAYSTISPWSKFGTIQKLLEPSVITANSYTREYGDANPTFEYTSAVTLNGTPTITCAADETSAPGTYPITISQGTVTNTGLVFVDGTLTVTKAPLTITANSYIIHEGDAMPAFEAVYEGLKNNESESVVNPVISCSATDSNTPGIYDINVTATSDNYDITIEAGTLTIMPTKMSITIGDPGVGTYCSPYDLDFSTVTDFKAYIAAGYNSATGNVIVVSVKDVPAGTGLFLKGTPGTYDVPCGESSSYYVNMLVGVTEATTISATDGSMTNFLLSATNSSDACFRPISSTYNLRANRAYLQIPTYMVGSSAGANAVGIEFEEGVTGIDNSLSDMDANAHWFTLDGRKLNGKPTQKGIYVVNGQKVVIK